MRRLPAINPEQAADLGVRLQEIGQILIAVTNFLSQQSVSGSKNQLTTEAPKVPQLQGLPQPPLPVAQLLQQLFPQLKLPQAGNEVLVSQSAELNDRINRLQDQLVSLHEELPQLREEISRFREQMGDLEDFIRNLQA